ncbi:hypothetical protein GBF38_002147 [Nibea albiflora]|uniref:Uncharacterized protein n=1 Tax=Nibea albiflora TaxID=240163 RepID=A0ACB7EDB9_NIBAL|nr:hypothetical protein GBF38_002147 [Nibea albiflora]
MPKKDDSQRDTSKTSPSAASQDAILAGIANHVDGLKKSVEGRLDAIEATLSSLQKKRHETERRFEDLDGAMTANDTRFATPEATCDELQVANGLLRAKVNGLEGRSRRLNVRIVGIKEREEKGSPLLIALMAQMLRLQQENQLPSEVTADDMCELLVEQSKGTLRVQHHKITSQALKYAGILIEQKQQGPKTKLLSAMDVVLEVVPKVLQGFWLPPPNTRFNMPSQQLSKMAVGVTKAVQDRLSKSLSSVLLQVTFSSTIRDNLVLSIQETVRQGYPHDVLVKGLNSFAAEVINTITDAAVQQICALFPAVQTPSDNPAHTAGPEPDSAVVAAPPCALTTCDEPPASIAGPEPDSAVVSAPPCALTTCDEPPASIAGPEPDSAVVSAPPCALTTCDEPPASIAGPEPDSAVVSAPPCGLTDEPPASIAGPEPDSAVVSAPPCGLTDEPPASIAGPEPDSAVVSAPTCGLTDEPPASIAGPEPDSAVVSAPPCGLTDEPPTSIAGPEPDSAVVSAPPCGLTDEPPASIAGPEPDSAVVSAPPCGLTDEPPASIAGPEPDSAVVSAPPRGLTDDPPASIAGPEPDSAVVSTPPCALATSEEPPAKTAGPEPDSVVASSSTAAKRTKKSKFRRFGNWLKKKCCCCFLSGNNELN